jgi:precorrin-6Y C5,15-methyltransferase (decarboxylating)
VITVIGYDGSALSAQSQERIRQAALVVGGARHLDAVDIPSGASSVVMGEVASAVEQIAKAAAAGDDVVVLASGDPGFFGIARRLAEEGLVAEVIPAPSSVGTAFARLGLPWDDAVVVSAHGRPLRPALNVVRRFPKVAVLTDANSGPATILRELGASCPPLVVFERLGESDERITRISGPRDAEARDWAEPNLVVALRPSPPPPLDQRNQQGSFGWLCGPSGSVDQGNWAGWALGEEAFEHRDGMVTKPEVRALALARLAPGVGQLVWDIGAGSGSVAVECARLGAAAVAVERKGDDCARIRRNAQRHGVPVEVVEGSAPDALAELPLPDAVFIGGGGPDVVAAVAARRPERVVVTLAQLERVAPTVAALGSYDVDTVLLQASALAPLADGHRLVPANPVFVVSGVLR